MIYYNNEKDLSEILNTSKDIKIVFVKGEGCSVCHAVETRVNKTFPDLYPTTNVHFISMEDSPLFRGQHLVFSVPTIIVFDKNKEIHRESAIIDFTRLYKVLDLVTK